MLWVEANKRTGATALFVLIIICPLTEHYFLLQPPWPKGMPALTLLAILGSLLACLRYGTSGHRPWNHAYLGRSGAVFLVALLTYLVLLHKCVFEIPSTHERILIGFNIKPNIVGLLNASYTTEDALRGAEYDPFAVWTEASILLARFATVVTWLVVQGSLAACAGLVVFRPTSLPAVLSKANHSEAKGRVLRIFVSYSHQDSAFLGDDELLGYLAVLEKEQFTFWHDRRIATGESWDTRIRESIEGSDIALVLVSQNFLRSEYCQSVEIERFLELRRERGLIIYPILLSPCDWRTHEWLSSTQSLPRDGRSIELHYQDPGARKQLYLDILIELREWGKQLRSSQPNANSNCCDPKS